MSKPFKNSLRNRLGTEQSISNPLYNSDHNAADKDNLKQDIEVRHLQCEDVESGRKSEKLQKKYEEQILNPFITSLKTNHGFSTGNEMVTQVSQQMTALYAFFQTLYDEDEREKKILKEALKNKELLVQQLKTESVLLKEAAQKLHGKQQPESLHTHLNHPGVHPAADRFLLKGPDAGVTSKADGRPVPQPIFLVHFPYQIPPRNPVWSFYRAFLHSFEDRRTSWLAAIWILIFLLAVALLIGLLVPWHSLKSVYVTSPLTPLALLNCSNADSWSAAGQGNDTAATLCAAAAAGATLWVPRGNDGANQTGANSSVLLLDLGPGQLNFQFAFNRDAYTSYALVPLEALDASALAMVSTDNVGVKKGGTVSNSTGSTGSRRRGRSTLQIDGVAVDPFNEEADAEAEKSFLMPRGSRRNLRDLVGRRDVGRRPGGDGGGVEGEAEAPRWSGPFASADGSIGRRLLTTDPSFSSDNSSNSSNSDGGSSGSNVTVKASDLLGESDILYKGLDRLTAALKQSKGSNKLLAAAVSCGFFRYKHTGAPANYTLSLFTQPNLKECADVYNLTSDSAVYPLPGAAQDKGRCMRCPMIKPNVDYVLFLAAGTRAKNTGVKHLHFKTILTP